jgi:hypothetical protein
MYIYMYIYICIYVYIYVYIYVGRRYSIPRLWNSYSIPRVWNSYSIPDGTHASRLRACTHSTGCAGLCQPCAPHVSVRGGLPHACAPDCMWCSGPSGRCWSPGPVPVALRRSAERDWWLVPNVALGHKNVASH